MYGDTSYSVIKYGQNLNIEDISEVDKIDLLSLLPPILHDIDEIKVTEKVLSDEISRANHFTNSFLKQQFINDATWGLVLWEKKLGIETSISRSYEFRRENIISKLRGAGTFTKSMLKNIILAFTSSDAEVIEYPNENRFVIKFIGILGIPKNMAGLIESIDLLKPAHLIYSFDYKYTVWNFLKDDSLTWIGSSLKTWNDLKAYK